MATSVLLPGAGAAAFHGIDDPDDQAGAEGRGEGRLWTIDTGHDLVITEPDFVAGAPMEIAGRVG